MKLLSVLLLAAFIPCAGFAEVVHLKCNNYDVVVDFLDDGASISVNGMTYNFIQEYDARASFHNPEPWMRLEVGLRSMGAKYSFATLIDDMPTYMPCEEIQ